MRKGLPCKGVCADFVEIAQCVTSIPWEVGSPEYDVLLLSV